MKTSRRPGRRGLAIVPALFCLVLVSLLAAVMLRQSHTRRSLVGDEERRMQAEWLAEAGLARASARLAADRGYRGETWEVAAGSLGGDAPGAVKIVVEADEKPPGRRRVRVQADYPRGEGRRARLTKDVTIEPGPGTSGGPT